MTRSKPWCFWNVLHAFWNWNKVWAPIKRRGGIIEAFQYLWVLDFKYNLSVQHVWFWLMKWAKIHNFRIIWLLKFAFIISFSWKKNTLFSMLFYKIVLRKWSKILIFEKVIFFWQKSKKMSLFLAVSMLILEQEDHCTIVIFRPPFFEVSFLDLFSN